MIVRSISEIAGTDRDIRGESFRSRRLLRQQDGVHPISPGTMYALDQHDRHILRAHTNMALVCVFWPALTGVERHNAVGGYDPAAAAAPAD